MNFVLPTSKDMPRADEYFDEVNDFKSATLKPVNLCFHISFMPRFACHRYVLKNLAERRLRDAWMR